MSTTSSVRFGMAELAAITRGEWLVPAHADAGHVTGVTDDSRHVDSGALFVAIRGEEADGHDYVDGAVQAGAAALCVEQKTASEPQLRHTLRASGRPCLLVKDTLRAFQELALAHRLLFPDLVVVAVTGSSGKTSTKEMIAGVLEAQWPDAVLRTQGNTNNHFGVPRNLLRLNPDHRAAVLELGSNHPGEIASLARLVQPSVGVVVSVGPAHLEFFGDLRGVAREKGSLYAELPGDGTAVLPTDGPQTALLRTLAGGRPAVSFGEAASSDVRVEYEGWSGEGYRVTLTWRERRTSRPFTWGIGGAHQARNAASAAAVGEALGIDHDQTVAALSRCRLPHMRMAEEDIAGVHWVNDAYNSNPQSARAAMLWFRERTRDLSADRSVLVLGDMLELGAAAPREHADLLSWAGEHFPGSPLVAVGPVMNGLASRQGIAGFEDADAAREYLADTVGAGAWVLVKASRGIRLERVLPGSN